MLLSVSYRGFACPADKSSSNVIVSSTTTPSLQTESVAVSPALNLFRMNLNVSTAIPDLKEIDRRMGTLKTHLAQVDIRKNNAAVYKKYMQLDPKKRGAYMKKHAGEIEQNESATKYLKDHLNGYGKIPEKSWRAAHETLTAERYWLCDEYYKLKDAVKNVEVLRRGEHHERRYTGEDTHSDKGFGTIGKARR